MEEQRELARQVRALYELSRAQGKELSGRKAPAAALEALLRADDDAAADDRARGATGLSGAFTPAAARRALGGGRGYSSSTLIITDGEVDLALLFTPSGIKAMAAGFSFPSLARRLVEKGRLKTNDLARVEASTGEPGGAGAKGEQEALVAAGVPAEVVGDCAAEVVGQVLLDALFWSEPMFEASPGEAEAARERRDAQVLTISSRAAKTLVQGALERMSELAPALKALPSLRASVSLGGRVDEKKSAALAGRQVELLEVVTARPGLPASELPDALVAAGRARPPLHALARDLQDLAQKGLLALGAAKPASSDRLRPADESLGPLARRLRIAKGAFDAGDRRGAARALSRAGTHLLSRGRAQEAARCLVAARALAIDDLEAHDGLCKALWACERKDEARAEAEALVRRFIDAKLPGRARRVALRSLHDKEETPLLLLCLEAVALLGESRALTELGEKLVARLRTEGRRAESQALADALTDHVDGAARGRLLRAGGVSAGNPIVGRVAVALVAALALGLVPAVHGLRARSAYGRALADAHAVLGANPAAFERVSELFAGAAEGHGEAAEAARRVRARADLHLEDQRSLEQLREALAARDVDGVLRCCDRLKANTPSLERRLAEVRAAAEARRATAQEATYELGRLEAERKLPEAYACARRLLTEFTDAPAILQGLTLPVRVTSLPGAKLRWHRAAFQQSMPFDARLPLIEQREDGSWAPGERQIEVSLGGHEVVELSLSVMTLPGPDVRVGLRSLGERLVDVEVPLRDGVMRDGAPAPLRFAPPAPLTGVRLPPRWRARVDAVHERVRDQAQLASFVVTLEQQQQQGGAWTAERSVSIALPAPLTRQVNASRSAPPLERTPGLDLEWLRDQVQRAATHILERRGQR